MNVSGRMLDKSTGDVASDGYHKYKFYDNLIDELVKYVQNGWIGINVYTFWYYPFTNSSADIEATQRMVEFYVGCCGELLTTDASMQLQGMRHLVSCCCCNITSMTLRHLYHSILRGCNTCWSISEMPTEILLFSLKKMVSSATPKLSLTIMD
ncbi:hypothetical protein BHE74_00035618 [Ensete ventricosum]|nr:hypothetical protein BHE74_00035618 [Ensete ventricosum]